MRTVLNILSKWGPSATNTTTKKRMKNVFKLPLNDNKIHSLNKIKYTFRKYQILKFGVKNEIPFLN